MRTYSATLGARDYEILKHLWKWKVATTATLTHKFFPESSGATAYKRLWSLACSGFIGAKLLNEAYGTSVWTLTQKGFISIRETLPGLASQGYKSEYPKHDILVAAVHQGDFLSATPPNVKMFTEQQLRCYAPEFYPSQIPVSTLHRPDGYTIIREGGKYRTVALEVELSPKKKCDYEVVFDYYKQNNIDDVLWVTSRQSLAKRIASFLPERNHTHSFALLEDFAKHGWGAEIKLGRRSEETIRSMIGTRNNLETSPKPVSALFLLDFRKAPHRSRTSASFQNLEIVD